jgi:hypothetical protein
MDDAFGKIEAGSETAACPVDDGSSVHSGGRQALWRVGTVAEQIGRGEAQDILQHCLLVAGYAIDGRVDETLTGIVTGSMVSPCARIRPPPKRRPFRSATPAMPCPACGPAYRPDERQNRPRPVQPRRPSEALRQCVFIWIWARRTGPVGKLLSSFEIVKDITHAKALIRDLYPLALGRVDHDQTGGDSPSARKIRNVSGSFKITAPHSAEIPVTGR